MPTRNINLTDHYDHYLTDALASGRYKNASEVVRAGLRLLELEDKREEAKLEALRAAFQEGKDAYERGEYVEMHTPEDIDQFFDELNAEVERTPVE